MNKIDSKIENALSNAETFFKNKIPTSMEVSTYDEEEKNRKKSELLPESMAELNLEIAEHTLQAVEGEDDDEVRRIIDTQYSHEVERIGRDYIGEVVDLFGDIED